MVKKTIGNSLILKTFNYSTGGITGASQLTWHCKSIRGHRRGLMLSFKELLIHTGKGLCFINCTYESGKVMGSQRRFL